MLQNLCAQSVAFRDFPYEGNSLALVYGVFRVRAKVGFGGRFGSVLVCALTSLFVCTLHVDFAFRDTPKGHLARTRNVDPQPPRAPLTMLEPMVAPLGCRLIGELL